MFKEDYSEGTGRTSPWGFKPTRWSVVLSVADTDPAKRAEALEQLCHAYREPIFTFIRHKGLSVEDAQDKTQAFFAQVLEKDILLAVDPEKGRFRSFLLGCVKHFLWNEHAKEQTQKRGGGKIIISLDTEAAEKHYQQQASENLTAEELYDRRWALNLLDRAYTRLRSEMFASGKGEKFEVLKPFLSMEGSDTNYEQVSQRLKMTPSAVRKEVQRMRRRLRKMMRAEVAHTLRDPSEVDAEMHYLISLLSR